MFSHSLIRNELIYTKLAFRPPSSEAKLWAQCQTWFQVYDWCFCSYFRFNERPTPTIISILPEGFTMLSWIRRSCIFSFKYIPIDSESWYLFCTLFSLWYTIYRYLLGGKRKCRWRGLLIFFLVGWLAVYAKEFTCVCARGFDVTHWKS